MSRLDEIQARVDAATPGPWDCVNCENCVYATDTDTFLATTFSDNRQNQDAAFIAHAPADVRFLLARVRALETGLAWYADLDNYLGHCPEALGDRGTRARTALAANEG